MTAVNSGPATREQVLALRDEGRTYRYIGQRFGRSHQWAWFMVNHGVRTVPIEPLRDAFERSGMTATEVAMRADWFDHRGHADGIRVQRALGLKTYPCGRRGNGNVRRRLQVPTAVALVRGLGLDPHEIEGL